MTSRATIGRFAINEVPTATNQGFIVVRPASPQDKWWLYYEMRSRLDEMISISNGSTFLELSRRNFKEMPVAFPVAETRHAFHVMADSIQVRARAAALENKALAGLRDMLLPKLLSGELRIMDTERLVSNSV
jgi:type I restriction enzyme S subunit